MTTSVSRTGINNLVEKVNEAFGEHLVDFAIIDNTWEILVADRPVMNFDKLCEAIIYLEGLLHAAEVLHVN